MNIETPAEIHRRWTAEGREYRPVETAREYQRQCREAQRVAETDILVQAERLDPNDYSLRSRHLREVAAQISDHRSAGNYTTSG